MGRGVKNEKEVSDIPFGGRKYRIQENGFLSASGTEKIFWYSGANLK